MLSDSEDDLDLVPAFIKLNCLEENTGSTSSRIDDLLAEHRREIGKVQNLKDQLMDESESTGKEISKVVADKDLMSEHADVIEKMKVKSIKVKTVHPGLQVFNPNNFGCLFTDNISPVSYFKNRRSLTDIDRKWFKFSLDDLDVLRAEDFPNIITSNSLSAIIHWLFDLMSIHRCSLTAYTIGTTLKAVLNRFHLSRNVEYCWKLSAVDLLRVLVNFGADPQELTESQTVFAQEEIRKHLVNNDMTVHQPQEEGVSSERFQVILCVLHVALQGRSKDSLEDTRSQKSLIAKDDLNLIFFMLAKAALDNSLDRTMLWNNFCQCFTAIINHYSESDWPFVVPELCRQLSKVTDHHHNQVYLATIVHSVSRGTYLQTRLSYVFLYNHLMCKPLELEDSQLLQLQLMDVVELGVPVQKGQPSTLLVKLHHLVKKDLYLTYSVSKLLDLSVGDITCIAAAQKKQLEYLLNQMIQVPQTIRESVHELDLSTVKHNLHDLTVKWSMALQHQRQNQGSIFSWATATNHQRVMAEILVDRKDNNVTDKGANC